MLTKLKSIYIILLFSIFSAQARAELVPALKITTEYFPEITYEVGFDVNPKTSLIDRVYFNESNAEPVFFTLNELQKDYIVIFKKWGFNFVKLRIVKMTSATSGTIEISILKYAFFGTRTSIFYNVALNPQTGAYEIVDQRTRRPLRSALVKTNYRAGVAVGIRDIEPL